MILIIVLFILILLINFNYSKFDPDDRSYYTVACGVSSIYGMLNDDGSIDHSALTSFKRGVVDTNGYFLKCSE